MSHKNIEIMVDPPESGFSISLDILFGKITVKAKQVFPAEFISDVSKVLEVELLEINHRAYLNGVNDLDPNFTSVVTRELFNLANKIYLDCVRAGTLVQRLGGDWIYRSSDAC